MLNWILNNTRIHGTTTHWKVYRRGLFHRLQELRESCVGLHKKTFSLGYSFNPQCRYCVGPEPSSASINKRACCNCCSLVGSGLRAGSPGLPGLGLTFLRKRPASDLSIVFGFIVVGFLSPNPFLIGCRRLARTFCPQNLLQRSQVSFPRISSLAAATI